MSRLNIKMAADKLEAAARIAKRNGDEIVAATILNVATVYLRGRGDVMKLLAASTHAAVLTAKQVPRPESSFKGEAAKSDPIQAKFGEASDVAMLHGRADLASILEYILAIYTMDRKDLIAQLGDVAASFSSKSVGDKPKKEVMIVDNDFDEAASGD